MSNNLKTTKDLEKEMKLYINPLLNHEPRFFGYPVGEFAIFLSCALASMHGSIIVGISIVTLLIVFKKKREVRPKDWFFYVPYEFFKLKYNYFLPPGKKTFLP